MYSRSKSILMSFCFCVFVILGLATNDDDNGGIENNKTVVVQLHPGYLSYLRGCGKNIFDQASKNIEITIRVDIVKARTSKTKYQEHTFIRDNDDNHEPNLRFSGIEVPKSGTFTVTVLVNGLSCFTCCFSNSSCLSGQGKPFYRGFSDPIHVDDIYDGYEIYIVPVYQECL